MKERVEVMISAEAIAKRLEEIAEQVYEDFAGEQVELVCALKGGVTAVSYTHLTLPTILLV